MLSIAIISRSAANLQKVLLSISESKVNEEMEVLVSWNSKDDPPYFPDVEETLSVHYYQVMPYNFAKNNNLLSRHAGGEFILFMNDDIVVDPGCLQAAINEIRKPENGIVGANLRYEDSQIQHAGVFFNDQKLPYHRLKHEVHYLADEVANDEYVPAVTGAFMLLRRSEFNAIKFDERFTVAGEDIVLCLAFRKKFRKGILYCANATAIHYENVTRKETDERSTPAGDLALIMEFASDDVGGVPLTEVRRPRVRIVTEKPGWIMHRKALEIQKHMGDGWVKINEDWDTAEINYYINYGYLNKKPKNGLTVANFTHFDPDSLAEKFVEAAFTVDYCTSVSELTTDKLLEIGVPASRITTIRVGADKKFRPMLVLGVSGRPYKGGRKGEDILNALLADGKLMKHVRVVAVNPDWGLPVYPFEDMTDFYRSIDYLLVTSRIEGGPVPFMEALACGTLSIAPPIGVVPEFPHIAYETGSTESLLSTIERLVAEMLSGRGAIANTISNQSWAGWSVKHEKAFRRLLLDKDLS